MSIKSKESTNNEPIIDESIGFVNSNRSSFLGIPEDLGTKAASSDDSDLMKNFYLKTFGSIGEEYAATRIKWYKSIVEYIENKNKCLSDYMNYELKHEKNPVTTKLQYKLYPRTELNLLNCITPISIKETIFVPIGTILGSERHAITMFINIINTDKTINSIRFVLFDSESKQEEKDKILQNEIIEHISGETLTILTKMGYNTKNVDIQSLKLNDIFGLDFCPYLQTKADNQLCSAWAAYFMYLVLMNPKQLLKNILNYMNNGSKEEVHKRLIDFLFFVLCKIGQYGLCMIDTNVPEEINQLVLEFDPEYIDEADLLEPDTINMFSEIKKYISEHDINLHRYNPKIQEIYDYVNNFYVKKGILKHPETKFVGGGINYYKKYIKYKSKYLSLKK